MYIPSSAPFSADDGVVSRERKIDICNFEIYVVQM